MPSVLIVDDLLSIHEMLEAVIQPTGFNTTFTTDGEKALAKYKTEKYDLVLADVDMKPMDGITLLRQLKQYDSNCVVIIMTAYASTESAIQALKFGAFDYLQKPFRVDELIATLRRGIEFKNFQAERASGEPVSVNPDDLEGRIIGESSAIQKLHKKVQKLIAARNPVLLIGEHGTGKSLIAEILHSGSNPADTELVRIDCSLGNDASFRKGLLGENGEGGNWIKQAKGGTLLLDHVETLSLEQQKELTSVLRNNAHGFRLICTTSEDLESLTDAGQFYDELFYRIASLPVAIPPLRDRTGDIPILARHFARQATNPQFDAGLVEFDADALKILSTYRWPGNLAEFNQVVSQIASTTETRTVNASQLPARLRAPKPWPTLAEHLAAQEMRYVEQVLRANQGDKAAAAKALGVDESRLG